MKSKVLLIGLIVGQLGLGIVLVGMALTPTQAQLKQAVVMTAMVEATPTPTVAPTPTNTPIEIEKPIEPQIVEKVIAQREFTVSRGGEPRRVKLTQERLETLPVLNMRATAYTLSVASCGKSRSHPEYGITFSGVRATVRRTVAVDPRVIPMKSVLYIDFPEEYDFRDGLYIAEDTGSAVKNDIIDIFFGEDKPGEDVIEKMCYEFGKRKVKVYIVERGE